jgi:hypothetical protein
MTVGFPFITFESSRFEIHDQGPERAMEHMKYRFGLLEIYTWIGSFV